MYFTLVHPLHLKTLLLYTYYNVFIIRTTFELIL